MPGHAASRVPVESRAKLSQRLRQVRLPLTQTHEKAGPAARLRPPLRMDNGNAKVAAEFEPPKYLANLIEAINDGAKAAQGSALLFLLVGVYLLATAFSSSDEDLLRGNVVTISQIGASLPVSFSFAIAPLVFVFMHLYSLVRYDMLAANTRHFLEKLEQVQERGDREDCRQLLANVEFINTLTSPRSSPLYSRLWPWLFRGIIMGFPVAVLLLVQINALRYQSESVVWVQRAALALDLAALIWFSRRNSLNGSKWPETRLRQARRWAALLCLPAAVLVLNFFYLNVVPADADKELVRYGSPSEFHTLKSRPSLSIQSFLSKPLDTLVCPRLNWGCRYLNVSHRTLVDHVWDTKTITDIRKEGVSRSTLAAIDGLLLRGRSFRFAVLNGSRLYAADLAYTDLSGASLQLAILSGAQLDSTKLRDADMENADLRGAYLGYADLKGANLAGARLDGIIGTLVDLQGATLLGASLSGASLHFASLAGADLNYAKLSGADLFEADLRGSNLREARLQGASLTAAHLQGAYLRRANMLGADLSDADLHGAYLADARLWNVGAKGKPANFSLADARNVDFETAPTDEDRSDLSETLSNVPDVHDFIPREARRRLEDVLAHEPHGKFEYLASRERPVLVSMNPGTPTAAYRSG